MTHATDAVRLKHMLEAAVKAIDYTSQHTRTTLEQDEILNLAVVRLLEIVGEASRHISDTLKNTYPAVPWREIAGTRNRLTHGYFDVDLDIVWHIVRVDLPHLVANCATYWTASTRSRLLALAIVATVASMTRTTRAATYDYRTL